MNRSIRISALVLAGVFATAPAFAAGGQKLLPAPKSSRSTGGGMALYKGKSSYVPNPKIATPKVEDIDHEVISSTTHGAGSASSSTTSSAAPRTGSWFARNFRVNTRAQLDEVKNLRKAGEYGAAAEKLVELKQQPRGLFDRIAFMGARNKLAKDARKALKVGTKSANFEGATEALTGLNTMRDGKTLSLIGRFKQWNAKRVAKNNTKDVLDEVSPRRMKNLDHADSGIAMEGLSFLGELRNKGTDSRVYKRAEKRTLSRLMKTAKNFAKVGEIGQVRQIMQDVSSLAAFDIIAAKDLINKASDKAIQLRTTNARAYYKRGNLDAAAKEMVAAMKIEAQRGGNPATMFPRGRSWFGFGKTRRIFNMNADLQGRIERVMREEMAAHQAQQQAHAQAPHVDPNDPSQQAYDNADDPSQQADDTAN